MGLRHARARDLSGPEWHVCNDGVILCDYQHDYGIYNTEFNTNLTHWGDDWCPTCVEKAKALVKPKNPYWMGEYGGREFAKKTSGRIFVRHEADVQRVIDIIKELDEFEFGYLPDGFVTVMPEDVSKAKLTYGHKFELRTDLLKLECWRQGIEVMLVTGWRDPY